MQHFTVYREKDRFAGWPANYGIWSFGYEIVVGFTVGYLKIGEGFHGRDRSRPFVTMLGRSRDGGKSWEVNGFPGKTPGNRALSVDEHLEGHLKIEGVLSAQSFERLG